MAFNAKDYLRDKKMLWYPGRGDYIIMYFYRVKVRDVSIAACRVRHIGRQRAFFKTHVATKASRYFGELSFGA